ncbi:MAG: hypothetical protein COT84_03930 [Chlamydiae bacterium CG10_big_fil_rev_8_21_14_0_10_35_9]|nr:MAG: hypothetical protein COT84_03930 [Chlamydiae bacterium CG10_big_fil_rev_8_21_14_0_10_35_9]
MAISSGASSSSNHIKKILIGADAFYNNRNYLELTKKDLCNAKSVPVSYTHNTEYSILHKIEQVAKKAFIYVALPVGLYMHFHIFSVIVVSIGLHKLIQTIARSLILPASLGKATLDYDFYRRNIPLDTEWKYKRITVAVDDNQIDAMIVGKPTTLDNGKWTLYSNGNGEFYETKPFNPEFHRTLTELNSNAIVFNYPGVGASTGPISRKTMAKAYKAMLTLLEDKKKGIGAREIIGYGHSIGGGVQGDALLTHELKKEIKYVFVKSRTFSDLSTLTSLIMARVLGLLVKVLGWNIDSVTSSKKLQVPEIILQTARVENYEELNDSSKIVDDGIIRPDGSLASALLNSDCKDKKVILGIKEKHNDVLQCLPYLAGRINTLLQRQ